ncbi:hypothetical protein LTR36_009606 [Oleoguttula mirabilis]|uniref:DUF7703 domain-containing protein n=1 Tax=Oleoguttula mirabilis TaxID=1507867 RepID=A0AAV9J5R1_9PEZI|nr:hypothetical protein LTR36_009606 [Oleoguttula mirabilis]
MDAYDPSAHHATLLSRANATTATKHKTFFDTHHSSEAIEFVVFNALVLYNVLELLILIFTTFRRFRGLYFTSMLVATTGILLYTIGTMTSYYHLAAKAAGLTLRAIGWPAMITGQSLVLYSRLSVMFMGEHQNVQKAMKWTIIVDALLNHTITIILTFGNAYASPHATWNRAFNIQHKFGRTCFTIQELVLSGLYIWRAVSFLRNSAMLNDKKRMVLVMWQLIAINVIIEGLDIYVLYQEFAANHPVRQMIKVVVYSIKLKLEFAVLSQLVDITTESRSNFGSYEKNGHLSSVHEEHELAHAYDERHSGTSPS